MVKQAAAVVVFLLGLACAAKFPKEWGTPCKFGSGHNECIKDGGTKAIKALLNGNPSLGIYPLDPIRFNKIEIDQGTGPVSIKLTLKNIDVTGVKQVVIQEVKNDWKEMNFKMFTPRVTMKGRYEIKGKVLVLPIVGNGTCDLRFESFQSQGKVKYSTKKIKGKSYYNMEKIDFTFDIKNASIKLDNLFNGDKALGRQMNIFLNENWKEVVDELKPAVAKSFGEAIKEIGNRIFSKISSDLITPP